MSEIQELSLVKDGETYIFRYTLATANECLRRLGMTASNNELSFSWYDAAVLCQKVRAFQERSKNRITKHIDCYPFDCE